MHYLIYFFIVAVLVFIDQFSKSLIVSTIDLNQSITVIKSFFNITYVRNFGAGFSIMQNATTTFYIITPICLILFIYLLIRTKKKDYLSKIALLLMIGGTIGNFLDRIINIYVVDFLDFIIFGWDFPVFNFADICLTIGVGIYIVSLLKESKNERA